MWLLPHKGSLSLLKASHDLIKYEAEVMDDFISERQHPSEIQARPALQMASW